MAPDLYNLPHASPRRYLPEGLAFEWGDVSRFFDELASRQLNSVEELQRWMMDEAELDAFLSEQRTIRYVNMTRQTDDEVAAKAYEWYINEMEPKLKVAEFELLKKYNASPFRKSLPRGVFGEEDRRREAALSIFRVENVELEKQDSALAQSHQKVTGGMTVVYRGAELTLQQMAKFYEETDRGVREEAWRLATDRALKDKDVLDGIYDRMVALRNSIAKNAGYDNYEDYIFVRKARFDYSKKECEEFHRAVEETLVPLSREIDRRREERMGVDVLRPWDKSVDPEGRPPLSPFEDAAGLVKGAQKVVAEVDPQLSGYFRRMSELGMLDLESRKGKAPGGYQEGFAEARLPFIFMNAAKRDDDVRTLLHEAGHSFHTFLIRDAGLPYFNDANVPMEFAEVASMSMEVISGEHYAGAFYDEADARRSNWEEAVSNVKLFTWVATIDAFQQWVYHHPEHTREERAQAWEKTFDRFRGSESYEGLDDQKRFAWQRQLHLFEVPFYYIEYGIALTGALGVWRRYRKDPKDAIEAYKQALSLGAARPLPDLFAAAGVRFDFGPSTMAGLAAELRRAIEEYGG